jgi:phage tail sheath protein FI
VSAEQFAGSESERSGIRGLVIADEVTMLVVPDLASASARNGQFDLELYKAVQTAMIDHCQNTKDRVAILDAPPGMSPEQVKAWRSETAGYDSRYAALYYPWITVTNPLAGPGSSAQATISIPPSGHMAGIWSRNDDTRGVWKAPANEVVAGALDVEIKVTKGEQDLLNPLGINCIRPFGIRGIRVWGGRTLSSDPSWRYINVRRLFNYVEESILEGTQWVVFEPNDLDLWSRVKRTIYAFLLGLWRQGALFGATPEEAFYVKCDAETNPPESVDEGKLVVEVGIAPVKPAEFVIFRISQWQGGAGAAE